MSHPYTATRARVATIFGREPAVVAALIQAGLAMALSFGWLAFIGLDSQPELAILSGLVLATLDLYVAFVTRATLLAVAIGFVKALIAFGTVYGINLSLEQTGSLIAFLTLAIGFFQRTQTTPLEFAEFDLAE